MNPAAIRQGRAEMDEAGVSSLPVFRQNNRSMKFYEGGVTPMKHIKTLTSATLKQSAAKGGCGECQTSCQSACKTSCTVANQKCENK